MIVTSCQSILWIKTAHNHQTFKSTCSNEHSRVHAKVTRNSSLKWDYNQQNKSIKAWRTWRILLCLSQINELEYKNHKEGKVDFIGMRTEKYILIWRTTFSKAPDSLPGMLYQHFGSPLCHKRSSDNKLPNEWIEKFIYQCLKMH